MRVPERPGHRAIGGPPVKDPWPGPICYSARTTKDERMGKRQFTQVTHRNTQHVVLRDEEFERGGGRVPPITSHRADYQSAEDMGYMGPPPETAGLARSSVQISLSAPVSEVGGSARYEGEDFPAGKPRWGFGGRHELCPGFTHERVIGYAGEDDEPSYSTESQRSARKLYKATERRTQAKEGKHFPKKQAQPWDESVALRMKARSQEDEWRRVLRKCARVPSEALRDARTEATHTTAVSAVPTSVSMMTAGLGCAYADARRHEAAQQYALGNMAVPLFPGDRKSVAGSSVHEALEALPEEDYRSVAMNRTDRLSHLLRVDGGRP